MDYKKYYELKTGKTIPANFEIHHLDLNIANNEISNLVALPKDLHSYYHASYRNILSIGGFSIMHIPVHYQSDVFHYYKELVDKHYKYYCEVIEYVLYRDVLLGRIISVAKYQY